MTAVVDRLPSDAPAHLPAGPFGSTTEQCCAAPDEARMILSKRAASGTPISYSELAGEIDAIRFGPQDIRFHSLLGEVSKFEHRHGRPLLSVLVVHKAGSQDPGKGFYTLARELGHNVSNQMQFWSEEFKRVVASCKNHVRGDVP